MTYDIVIHFDQNSEKNINKSEYNFTAMRISIKNSNTTYTACKCYKNNLQNRILVYVGMSAFQKYPERLSHLKRLQDERFVDESGVLP